MFGVNVSNKCCDFWRGDFLIHNENLWLKILYKIRIKKVKQKKLAEKYNLHVNTITNIKKKFAYLSDEEIEEYHRKRNCKNLTSKRRTKITNECIEAIKDVCIKNLNCYLDEYSYTRKLLNEKKLDWDYVRRVKRPRKNYNEAFEEFKKTKAFETYKICYSSFCNYGKEFWKEPTWSGRPLGEIIDEKIIFPDDEEPDYY